MNLRSIIKFGCICTFAFASAFAAMSDWTDLQGTSFKGEPKGIYGPFALFKTGSTKGRRVLLRMLSPEDCVRFYKEVSAGGKYERASDWSQATSSLSLNLKGRLFRLEKDRLLKANLQGLTEPELYVCFFASGWEGSSYDISRWYRATYDRLRRLYGNQMETVYLGVRHDSNEGFAKNTRMPWLTVDYGSRDMIDPYKNFAPNTGAGMVLLNREGVPLIMTEVNDLQGMKKFVDELCALMAAADERNPLFWKDRAYYLANIRPLQFADKSVAPLLIGNPLRSSTLRKNKIDRITAKLEIDAAGKVTASNVINKEALPPALVASLEKALQSSFIFVPAIDRGKSVAASYDFDYVVPDEKTAMETDRDWVILSGRKEISIPNWLLLRPIPVPAVEFSKVDHVKADGTMVMTAVKVGEEAVSKKSQMNAFSSNFFDKEGAANLIPFKGKSEEIDEQAYYWDSYESKDGFVDMRNKQDCDYCVGYAWAEFEAPRGGPAYFGIGSDDGIKIWLNGTLVHDSWTVRPTQIDQDIIPLQLTPGKNTVLIKIQNRKDAWSFFFRLRQ